MAVLFLLLTGLYSVCIPLSHDIKSMLPDKDTRFQEDFELFSYAPFARNILISLEVSDIQDQMPALGEVSSDSLTQAADKITQSLKPPFFVQAVSGISQSQKLKLFNWMYDHLPCLINEADIAFLTEEISPASIDQRLQENIRVLHSPESIVLKELILQDPLAFRRLLLGKLQQLNIMSGFSVDSDYFLSKDNKHLLIIVETSIAITDFGRSREMLDYLYRVLDEHVPAGIQYRVICGHRYTVANAETIQSDLWRVFAISITGLLLLFAIFLHNWRALFVFVMPIAALLTGATVTGLLFGTISAVTVGFGAVLLGISADFGLHVFYGLQQSHTGTRRVLADLTKPLSYCALTTIGVFAVLLFSSLPGQRQLAVFSIAGIATALLFALFVMPHLMPASPVLSLKKLSLPRARVFAVPLWLVITLVAAIPATHVRFDGNIRSIGMMPKDILEDEIRIRDTWGAVREQAIVFCAAESPEKALQKNDLLFQKFKHEMQEVKFLSLASLIPSRQAQEKNLKQWSAFWNVSNRKNTLRANIERQGLQYGFMSTAFEPFLQWIDQPRSTFTLADFEKECNDKLISPFVAELKNGHFAVLTFVPEDDAVTAFLRNMEPDIKIVSNRQFSRQLNHEIVSDFTRFFSWAIIIILVLLFILFRNAKKLILAFLPVLAGILVMSAIMSISGIKVNLFNMVAAVLVIGLAVDYGIFIVCTCDEAHNAATCNAVLVSGLTTFVGFGSLIIARHPAMNSIGITVASGIIPSLLCALTLLPYLTEKFLAAKKK